MQIWYLNYVSAYKDKLSSKLSKDTSSVHEMNYYFLIQLHIDTVSFYYKLFFLLICIFSDTRLEKHLCVKNRVEHYFQKRCILQDKETVLQLKLRQISKVGTVIYTYSYLWRCLRMKSGNHKIWLILVCYINFQPCSLILLQFFIYILCLNSTKILWNFILNSSN